MNIWEQLPKVFFALAPMDDVTDTVFRRVVARAAAPDIFFTEFTNVDGLQSVGRPRVMHKLRMVDRQETPLIAHVWGKNPENFYKTAQQIVNGSLAHEFGLPEGINFAGIDLNMGCPAKTEVKAGTCSALMTNRPLAQELIQATKEGAAGKLAVSVKTRLGFNEVDLSWHEFLFGQDIANLTIHGRTRKQMSLVPANWDLIGEIRALRDKLAPQTTIVGNGDVQNRQHGLELAQKYQLDGIMIARGVFQDPFVFSAHSPWERFTRKERISMYRNHVALFAETWQNDERKIHTLNKFCKVYINGFDGAKELREQLMNCQSTGKLLSIMDKAMAATVHA